jgi:hypothetical protein
MQFFLDLARDLAVVALELVVLCAAVGCYGDIST